MKEPIEQRMADAQEWEVTLTQKVKITVLANTPDAALVNAQGEAPTAFEPTSFSVKEAK